MLNLTLPFFTSVFMHLVFTNAHLLLQESEEPLGYIHFTAEGEVTFKSILFIPAAAPRGLFDEYGSKKNDFIKVKCDMNKITN